MFLLCWTDGTDPRENFPPASGPLWAARPARECYGWTAKISDARIFETFREARAYSRAHAWPFSAGVLYILRLYREGVRIRQEVIFRLQLTTRCGEDVSENSEIRKELSA